MTENFIFENLLALYSTPKIGSKTIFKLLEVLKPKELFSKNKALLIDKKIKPNLVNALLNLDTKITIEILKNIDKQTKIISYFDQEYPPLLKEISDPPLFLFCKGNIENLYKTQLAVVGARSANNIAFEILKFLFLPFREKKITITSGLAKGVDSFAHRLAIENNVPTIGVLGCGINVVYPKSNAKLYQDIVDKNGLIISEFLPNTAPISANFPRRNRIICALSFATLVVQAQIRSGSLITARLALEQGRDVFAIPGSIFDKNATGTNQLIQQGAKLITCGEDILDEIFGITPLENNKIQTNKETDLNETQKKVLDTIDFAPTLLDLILQRCGYPLEKTLVVLADLELKGLIVAIYGGYQRLGGLK